MRTQSGQARRPSPRRVFSLQKVAVAHRITQGINHAQERRNVKPYTGAVDISVRCLTEPQIQNLLANLANLGFAGWYRKDGSDVWTGPPHIHAVWAGCSLKPVLRQQVECWLAGGNGLGSNRTCQFWQPSTEMKEKVRALFRTSN